MKQISTKINTYANSVNITNNDLEGVMLKAILWSFGALAILYVLVLGNMVSNIIQRRALEASARSLTNEVGSLELNYLSLSNSVDLPFSYSLGFKETKKTFATRKTLGFKPGSNVKTSQNDI